MSVDYSSGVILGVRVADIGFKLEKLEEKFEIHDKKGKPTGKFDTDVSWKSTYKGEEKIHEYSKFHFDELENIVCPWQSGALGKLELFNYADYEEDFDINNVIVGIKLVEKEYDEWRVVKEIPQDLYSSVLNELKKLGVNKEPKMFFFFNAG